MNNIYNAFGVIFRLVFGFASLHVFKALAASYRLTHTNTAQQRGYEQAPKYPHKDPFLGTDLANRIQKGMRDGNLMQVARQNFESCGKTFQAKLMGRKVIYTMDSQNIQTVVALEFEKFGVEPLRQAASSMWMGKGIFVTDGPIWDHARRTLRPVFHRAQVGNLAAFEKHVSRVIDLIPRDGSVVDLQPLFHRLFLDSSTEYLFGDSTDSLISESRSLEAERFITSFDNVLRGVSRRQLLGPLMNLLGSDRQWKKEVAETHAQIDRYVNAALKRKQEREKGGTGASSPSSFVFVDQLVQVTQDRSFLRDQLLNVFFPARDSSAVGASCLFFILARNQNAWAKLRQEVLNVSQPITFENLKSLKYLTWVLNESLRILSPANRAVRTCLEDCILPRGGGASGNSPILVSKGTQIDMDFGQMQQDKAIWGEDADKFRPERWENLKPMWTFIPFLGGPRTCPAQQMVLTQYAYLLVRLMQEFERMDNRDETLEFVEEHKMTKQSRNGVQVAFVPARRMYETI